MSCKCGELAAETGGLSQVPASQDLECQNACVSSLPVAIPVPGERATLTISAAEIVAEWCQPCMSTKVD